MNEVLTSAAWRACECPTHRVILVRSSTGWVCPRGLACVPLIADTGLLDRVTPHLNLSDDMDLRYRQTQAVLKEIKRVSKETYNPTKG